MNNHEVWQWYFTLEIYFSGLNPRRTKSAADITVFLHQILIWKWEWVGGVFSAKGTSNSRTSLLMGRCYTKQTNKKKLQQRSDEQSNSGVLSDIFHRRRLCLFPRWFVKGEMQWCGWKERMLEGHRVVFNVLISPHICFYVSCYFLLHSYTSGIFLVGKMPE